MGDKTKIDWCDSTWNPVTGCYHDCQYCYARNIANRFSSGGENWTDDKIIVLDERKYDEFEENRALAYPYGFKPTLQRYKLDEYAKKKGRNIFVCSMADLFGNWVPDSWLDEVFKACEKAPQHNYLFLTKNPKRYAELKDKNMLPAGANMWYGFSITDDCYNAWYSDSRYTFVSIEPILGEIKHIPFVDWVIVGAETGRHKDKVIPKRKWIEDIANECKANEKPVFMKSSLADIWGEPLIQEFPRELKRKED